MIVSGSPFYDRVAKLLKDDAAKVGVEVIPDPYEWSIIMEKLSKRQFEAQMSGWGGSIEEDPYQIWHSSQIAGRGSNRIGFNNPQADALIEQARKVLDPTKRNALYHKFHQIVLNHMHLGNQYS